MHAACNVCRRVGLRRPVLITFSLCYSGGDRGMFLMLCCGGKNRQHFEAKNFLILSNAYLLKKACPCSPKRLFVLMQVEEIIITPTQIYPNGFLSSVSCFLHKWIHKTLLNVKPQYVLMHVGAMVKSFYECVGMMKIYVRVKTECIL